MNYNNPELINLLAAQYVLGTLKRLPRKRFQRLMFTSTAAREATVAWEGHLNDLSGAIKPVTPGENVWLNILQRVEAKVVTKTVIHTKPTLWKSWSLVATAASLVFAFMLLKPVSPVIQHTEQFALVQNEAQQPLWFIDVNDQGLSIKAGTQLTTSTHNDYELWMIVKDQEAPISLGLLPKGGSKLLVKNNNFIASNIKLLAVSLEPLGGSPNGSPTEVLYTAKLVTL